MTVFVGETALILPFAVFVPLTAMKWIGSVVFAGAIDGAPEMTSTIWSPFGRW
jgi:predicted membrane protein